MYAIIKDRGHQYKVSQGARITVDRLKADAGATIEMPVLLLADGEQVEVGSPFTGKKAVCKVVGHSRGKKGIAGFFRRRKDSRRRVGFRHDLSTLEIVSIG
ncbi:MAG: 50S ribosomal protein L21 [Planctomycetota bacterium]|nr:MAG: 50S ribosomal protein L21 [Planctomycetota bacterium]